MNIIWIKLWRFYEYYEQTFIFNECEYNMNKVWSIWIINEYYEQTFINGVYEHNMNKNMNIIWILLTFR